MANARGHQCENSHDEQTAAEDEQRHQIAIGSFLFGDADDGWAEVAAEISDGIDEGDASGGSGATEERARHGPERRDGAFDAGERDYEPDHGDDWIFCVCSDRETDR